MTYAELRQLYTQVVARRAPPPGARDTCLPPESLLAIVEGRASEVERIQALRHVAACGACRAELDLLRSAAEAGQRLKRRQVAVPALVVAASLAILAGAAVVLLLLRR